MTYQVSNKEGTVVYDFDTIEDFLRYVDIIAHTTTLSTYIVVSTHGNYVLYTQDDMCYLDVIRKCVPAFDRSRMKSIPTVFQKWSDDELLETS